MAEKERKLFGTDGIRGVANRHPMTPELVLRIGRAVASLFRNAKRRHRILIGRDTRLSGPMIEDALVAGICSMGVDALTVGVLPTPAVAFLTMDMKADAAIMISASHNPFEDNGIKIFQGNGLKLPDAAEARIEALIASERLGESAPTGCSDRAHQRHLRRRWPLCRLPEKRLPESPVPGGSQDRRRLRPRRRLPDRPARPGGAGGRGDPHGKQSRREKHQFQMRGDAPRDRRRRRPETQGPRGDRAGRRCRPGHLSPTRRAR